MWYDKSILLYANMKKQRGFSLVELAVVLMVIGLLMGASASLVQPYVNTYRYNSTKAKMDKIADAFAVYAQANYDLPCPADPVPTGGEPFGTPRGSGTNGLNMAVTCTTSTAYYDHNARLGMVPFKILGLTESQVKDAWGNYISYTLPTLYDRYKLDPTNRDDIVFAACRTSRWIEPVSGKNRNMKKAKFCCPHAYTGSGAAGLHRNMIRIADRHNGQNNNTFENDLFVRHVPGAPPAAPGDAEYSGYAGVDKITNTIATLTQTEFIAVILISAGMNRRGATNTDSPILNMTANVEESPNGRLNTLNKFIMQPLNMNPDPDYFDDIVVYRTNFQLMSAFRNNSCMIP